uniref:NDT80 domain-containing protein n=1 Tax=Steinernema glaseri TaxID=37863 RepID=A0A1I8ANI2_9BILA
MAKSRNFTSRGETGFCDPLGEEYSDNFNIIQFITGNETPIDSPVTPSTLPGSQQQPQLSHFASNNNGHFNGAVQPNQGTATMMYQDPRPTFPESPPITDISGGGSSGSPSSISDAPYSPDLYLTGSQYPENMSEISPHQLSPEMAMQLQHNRALHISNGFPHVGGYGYQPQTHGVVPQVQTQTLLNRQMNNYIPHEMLGNIGGMNCAAINDLQSKKRPFPINGMIKTEPQPSNKRLILAHANGMTPMTPAHIEEEPEEPHARKNMHSNPNDDASNRFQFSKFQENSWQTLYDSNQRPLHLDVKVVADKGFNYSQTDGCFVNQKKNHFQITVNIEAIDSNPPRYVKMNGMLKEVSEFKLVFCGVKNEMTSCEIMIKQSQTDRKPLPHEAVLVEIQERKRTKVTVPRLHFSETTMNNHRKHGRPNPEQKYFLLLVKLVAKTLDNDMVLIQSYQSERVIVRASNPGQFEPPEAEASWQRNGDTIYYKGPVAIGTEQANPNVALHVSGNMFLTGDLCRASDRNLKTGIHPLETREALERLQKIDLVHFTYKQEIADEWGLDERNRHRVGVIAQDLAKILPDAVNDNGAYLTVDDTRIFYDTVAAAQELYRLTGQLEGKIDKVEQIYKYKLGGGTRSLSVSRTTLCSKSPSMMSVLNPKKKRGEDRCQHDQVLCSSKLTQGTIIALVVVMTFCMLAMSALYCMDWYKKNQWHDAFHRGHTPTITDDKPGQIVIPGGSNVSWIPLSQPHVPMIPAYCERGPQCQGSCCARPVTMLRGSLPEETPNYLLIPPVEEGHDPKPANGLPISIKLVNSNITVDERFCVGGSCTTRHGRYTLYVPLSPAALTVPIRIRVKVGQTQNLHNCGAIDEFENEQCKATPVNYEESTKLDVEQLNEYSFQIPASKYTQSAFKFRVGRVTTLCNMHERLMGSTFEEYNIVFYRKCHTASR